VIPGAMRRPWLQLPLWVQLAFFAATGVAIAHAIHLVISDHVATSALAREQELLGRDVARLVAQQAADAVVVDDQVTLQEIVGSAGSSEHVAYCFIERDGKVLASSFAGPTPPRLVGARVGVRLSTEPLILRSGNIRYLDVAEPILAGSAGTVRLGLDMQALESTRHALAIYLQLTAIAVIAAGFIAALIVGRRIARPMAELLRAADQFDPSVEPRRVLAQGSREFLQLSERFNKMMARLKAAHDAQQKALQKGVATERLVALGSLVAGVAHEVNNPVAGLKNCHRLLKLGNLPEAKRREYLDLMEDSLTRIEETMRRLLDFGRPQPLTLRAERAADLAQDAGKLVVSLLRERHIEWVECRDQQAADVKVVADRRQVGQALLNLILNAAYVTPNGGQIRLRVRRKPHFCGMSVEDDGPGIPPEIRNRILDPFFSTKPEGEGTGLGLSVTRALVDAHRGDLTFEFPSRGTVATIWLPEAVPG